MTMKKPPVSSLHTLADTNLFAFAVRCSNCHYELPASTPIEVFETEASRWIVADCPVCHTGSPFQLEREVTA